MVHTDWSRHWDDHSATWNCAVDAVAATVPLDAHTPSDDHHTQTVVVAAAVADFHTVVVLNRNDPLIGLDLADANERTLNHDKDDLFHVVVAAAAETAEAVWDDPWTTSHLAYSG
jgi:hypothetical protein